MNLSLQRYEYTDKSTIAAMFIDAAPKTCDILELSCRRGDEKGKRAIPAGRYEIVITRSPKFKRDLPLLLDVPGRAGIRIHPANSPDELDGCLAPGVYDPKMPDWVSASRSTFNDLFKRIKEAVDNKEKVFITISGGLTV